MDDSLSKKNGFVLANCWSHARRKFIEAEASAPDDASDILNKMGAMFGIETEVDVKGSDVSKRDALALRARFREQYSKAIVNDIGKMAASIMAFEGSPLAKALQHLENRWDHLTVF
ncbi:MAG: transposase [Myxococcota bacterium]